MASKLEATLAKMRSRLEEKNYYDAHQTIRTIANRQVKQKNYPAAIELLYSSAQLMLQYEQGAEGADLGLYMIQVYTLAEKGPDPTTRAQTIQLLRLFKADEPGRKTFIKEALTWSKKFGEVASGDPEIQHAYGTILVGGDEIAEAEKHLIVGNRESPVVLAKALYEWYTEDEPHMAPMYISRAVLPYLALGNLEAAERSLDVFTDLLSAPSQSIASPIADTKIFPSLPLLNFLRLLTLSAARGTPDLWRALKGRYERDLRDVSAWDEVLEGIADLWFGVRKPRPQGNMLADLMSGMFGGGAGGGAPRGAPRLGGGSSVEGLD
ncbi:hypothetical protein YB2330_002567 [Saitoella coloradoensis]